MSKGIKQQAQWALLEELKNFIADGNTLDASTLDKFSESYVPTPNPYLEYSLSTLTILSSAYAHMLSTGQEVLGNGESLGEAYELVLEALEEREEIDYCRHGKFKWDEDLCHGCEMGE